MHLQHIYGHNIRSSVNSVCLKSVPFTTGSCTDWQVMYLYKKNIKEETLHTYLHMHLLGEECIAYIVYISLTIKGFIYNSVVAKRRTKICSCEYSLTNARLIGDSPIDTMITNKNEIINAAFLL